MKRVAKIIVSTIYTFLAISIGTILLYAKSESFKSFLDRKVQSTYDGYDVDYNRSEQDAIDFGSSKEYTEDMAYKCVCEIFSGADWNVEPHGKADAMNAWFLVDVGRDSDYISVLQEEYADSGQIDKIYELTLVVTCYDYVVTGPQSNLEVYVNPNNGRVVAIGVYNTEPWTYVRIK